MTRVPPARFVRPRATPRTDYILWLVLAAIPNLAFLALRLIQDGGSELDEEYSHPTSWAVLVLVSSVVLGWAAQEVAVRYGFRLTGRRPRGQFADYDDRLKPHSA